MMHPYVYAEMLAAKMQKHQAPAWLINTGWVGGGYGVGERCPLKYTRQLVDAVHDGTLAKLPEEQWEAMPIFGLRMPKSAVKTVPKELLRPEEDWKAADHLAQLFTSNFKEYSDHCTQAVVQAGPHPGALNLEKRKFEPET